MFSNAKIQVWEAKIVTSSSLQENGKVCRMQDFLAAAGCVATLVACFFVMKNTRLKRSLQVYPCGGKLSIESGKIYDVSFGLSECRIPMLVTDMHFAADYRGLDAVVRFDSRPGRFVTFFEGK